MPRYDKSGLALVLIAFGMAQNLIYGVDVVIRRSICQEITRGAEPTPPEPLEH